MTGGLGSAVAEVLLAYAAVPFRRHGVPDEHVVLGPPAALYATTSSTRPGSPPGPPVPSALRGPRVTELASRERTRTADNALRARVARVIPNGMYGHLGRLLPADYPQFYDRGRGRGYGTWTATSTSTSCAASDP